jgi:hypothetical protein
MMMIGEYVDQGPWYEATMDTAHEGHSATCTFPVHGTHGSAELRVRAVRYEGGHWSLFSTCPCLPDFPMLSFAIRILYILTAMSGITQSRMYVGVVLSAVQYRSSYNMSMPAILFPVLLRRQTYKFHFQVCTVRTYLPLMA